MGSIDITNQRFGKLTAVSPAGRSKNRGLLWLCKCDCGNEKPVEMHHLLRGDVKSCGCLVSSNLVGKRFGKLTVISNTGKSKNSNILWLCKCDCGNERLVTTAYLRQGVVKSCGCVKRYPSIVGERFGKLTVIEKVKDGSNSSRWRCICDCGKEVIAFRYNLMSGVTSSCGCRRVKRLEGQRFGKLTVIEEAGRNKHKEVLWKCLCDCGNEKISCTMSLCYGKVQSCGCLRAVRLEGQRFGRLTVIEETGRGKGKSVLWKCLCDCGNEKIASTASLHSGKVRSCGCIYLEWTKQMASENMAKNFAEGTNLLVLNSRPNKNNTSGVKGVFFDKRANKWRATLIFRGKRYWLGAHNSFEAAAKARREAEELLHDPILKKYGRNPTSEEEYQERLKAAIERQRERSIDQRQRKPKKFR